jgi:hypothetical protein
LGREARKRKRGAQALHRFRSIFTVRHPRFLNISSCYPSLRPELVVHATRRDASENPQFLTPIHSSPSSRAADSTDPAPSPHARLRRSSRRAVASVPARRQAAAMEPRIGNKFRVGRKLGSGSFGEIYLGSLPSIPPAARSRLRPKAIVFCRIFLFSNKFCLRRHQRADQRGGCDQARESPPRC